MVVDVVDVDVGEVYSGVTREGVSVVVVQVVSTAVGLDEGVVLADLGFSEIACGVDWGVTAEGEEVTRTADVESAISDVVESAASTWTFAEEELVRMSDLDSTTLDVDSEISDVVEGAVSAPTLSEVVVE